MTKTDYINENSLETVIIDSKDSRHPRQTVGLRGPS